MFIEFNPLAVVCIQIPKHTPKRWESRTGVQFPLYPSNQLPFEFSAVYDMPGQKESVVLFRHDREFRWRINTFQIRVDRRHLSNSQRCSEKACTSAGTRDRDQSQRQGPTTAGNMPTRSRGHPIPRFVPSSWGAKRCELVRLIAMNAQRVTHRVILITLWKTRAFARPCGIVHARATTTPNGTRTRVFRMRT